MTANIAVIAIAVLSLVLWLCIVPRRSSTLIASSLVLVSLSSTYLDFTKAGEGPGATGGLSIAARLAAVAVLLRLWWPMSDPSSMSEVNQPRPRVVERAVVGMLFGMTIYISGATAQHRRVESFLLVLTGVAAASIFAVTLVTKSLSSEIWTGVRRGLMSIITGSVIFIVLLPGEGILQDRARGYTSNPNLLGFYCAMLIAVLLLSPRSRMSMLAWLTTSFAILVWTGSRASLVLAAVMGLGYLLTPRPLGTKLAAGGVGISLITSFLILPDWTDAPGAGILRTGNSRETSWAYTKQVFSDRPVTGIGLGNELIEVASTPLRAVVHGGLLGLAGIMVVYMALIYYSAKIGQATLFLATGAVLHSFFEGWFLSPVSPLFLVFVAVYIATAKTDVERSRESVVSHGGRLRGRPAIS